MEKMTDEQNTCGVVYSFFEGIALLFVCCIIYLMSLLLCFIPFSIVMTFADTIGAIPMILCVLIAVVLPIAIMWSDMRLVWRATPFSLFLFAPPLAALLGLFGLVFSSGGPVDLKAFHAPETKASIVHNSVLNVDQILIQTHPHCGSCYSILGQTDADVRDKMHPENFASGVEVEALGFAAGSRTKANVLDRIVDTRKIVVKITGLNGETVNAVIPASKFKSERYDAERDNDEIAEAAAHPPEPKPTPPPLTDGMTPLGSR